MAEKKRYMPIPYSELGNSSRGKCILIVSVNFSISRATWSQLPYPQDFAGAKNCWIWHLSIPLQKSCGWYSKFKWRWIGIFAPNRTWGPSFQTRWVFSCIKRSWTHELNTIELNGSQQRKRGRQPYFVRLWTRAGQTGQRDSFNKILDSFVREFVTVNMEESGQVRKVKICTYHMFV